MRVHSSCPCSAMAMLGTCSLPAPNGPSQTPPIINTWGLTQHRSHSHPEHHMHHAMESSGCSSPHWGCIPLDQPPNTSPKSRQHRNCIRLSCSTVSCDAAAAGTQMEKVRCDQEVHPNTESQGGMQNYGSCWEQHPPPNWKRSLEFGVCYLLSKGQAPRSMSLMLKVCAPPEAWW